MPIWNEAIAQHQAPRLKRSIWQLVNTLIPYGALMGLMSWTAPRSLWVTLVLAVPAGALLVRIFTLFHDCAHGSFFRSSRANSFWGFLMGVLTFTPYREWRHRHVLHHATSGDLDRRGMGDIWTLTVEEYLEASTWNRLTYRLTRNPIVLFVLSPLYFFLVHQRFQRSGTAKRERASVYWTNAVLLGVLSAAILAIGVKSYLLVQMPVLMIAATTGIWLFYVQHQFEGAYWERGEDWDFEVAAMSGSSFYQLPRILQWFTGSIGFHHVHHLSPAIPNYNLEKCHREHPMFRAVKPLTLRSSMKSLTFRLWDEQRRKLVSYRRLREIRQEISAAASSTGT
jgi:omega-6 fatty acid desaturase (delta-12 desaturase)